MRKKEREGKRQKGKKRRGRGEERGMTSPHIQHIALHLSSMPQQIRNVGNLDELKPIKTSTRVILIPVYFQFLT